jgi:hypothetical protein
LKEFMLRLGDMPDVSGSALTRNLSQKELWDRLRLMVKAHAKPKKPEPNA